MDNLPIAKEGFVYIFFMIGVNIIFCFISPWLLIPGVLLLLFFAYFFRNPQRTGSEDPLTFFSPADGTIMSIKKVNDSFMGGEAQKITIFLSVFNVHINRAPMSADIVTTNYRPGKFLPAFKSHASDINERNMIGFENDNCRFVVHQITGFVARRIVCDVAKGDKTKQRQRIGMIKFGSCTELILPLEAKVIAEPGQKVKCGITQLAKIVQ